MKVKVYNKQKTLPILKSSVREAVKAVLKEEKVLCDEVAIYFVDTKAISSLHEKFFQDPSPTDCISFPIDGPKKKKDGYSVLGEVFICPETALNYAKKHKIDPFTEVTLYLVHGLLHLIGFDDLSPKKRKVMRKKEKNCMQSLKSQSLYIS